MATNTDKTITVENAAPKGPPNILLGFQGASMLVLKVWVHYPEVVCEQGRGRIPFPPWEVDVGIVSASGRPPRNAVYACDQPAPDTCIE
jgi:hypothetical protein